MRIIIPTRGRVNQQRTVSVLPRELLSRTTLVCPQQEQRRLACLDDDIEVVAQPGANMRIAATREWIIQHCLDRGYDKIIMLDDDLTFATRRSADDTRLRKIRGKELIREFDRLEEKLGPEFPHVGFGVRQGNDKLAEVGWQSPGRMCFTLAYYLPIVAKEAKFDLVEIREDFCMTLQQTFLPQTHPLYKVQMRALKADALGALEPQVLQAAVVEANNPCHVAPGELRKVEELDDYGKLKTIRWIGPESFVKAMSRPGRRVISFRTDHGYVDASGRGLR